MSMFILTISCLTTFNLPWFMDPTFRFLSNIALYSVGLYFHYQSYPQLCCFCLGSISSFFLALVLHWSPAACWAPTDLGSSSFSVLSFCLFILFMQFSRQEYWSGLPFLSPVGHVLSDFSTMTHPSSMVLYGMAHSFIKLDKTVVLVIRLFNFLWLWISVSLPSDEEG